MRGMGPSCCAIIVGVAIALLAGCGGSQPPTGAPGAMPQSSVTARVVKPDRSWMLPGAKNEDLLYVGGNNGYVTVYSYPQGKQVGALKNPHFFLPAGECTDKAGDVFITDEGADLIFEYRHAGTKAVETLQSAAGDPAGCAIDPTTGNLAVTSLGRASGGNVAIYSHAKGTPTTYTDPNIYSYFWCGYDPHGDLFVNGQAYNPKPFELAELPKGSSTFTDISLDHKIDFPSGVQWRGKYLVLGDQAETDVYQFSISGSVGTLVKAIALDDWNGVEQFQIDGDRVIGGNGGGTSQAVRFYDYPAGGEPTKTITRGIGGPQGLTVSKAKPQS